MKSKTIIKYQETSSNDPTPIILYGLDGCKHFVPSKGGLVCHACGCHWHFHKRVKMEQNQSPVNQVISNFFSSNSASFALPPPSSLLALIEDPFRSSLPQLSLPPPPPIPTKDSLKFASPLAPPRAPPQLTFTLYKTGATIASPDNVSNPKEIKVQSARMKRTRTKFTATQKQQMEAFANTINWGFRGQCKEEITNFCSAIGVTVRAFQIWISNKKSQSKVKQPDS